MKKLVTILLAIAFVATLSLASFAATITQPGAEGKDLAVGFTEMTAATTVYSVNIVWDTDLSFEYSAGTQGAWNPDNHSYGATTGAGWTDATAAVTVTNHSNAAVVASIDVVDTNETDGLVVSADKASDTLETAVGKTVAAADTVTFTLTIVGTPTESIAKVATATVSIAAAQ